MVGNNLVDDLHDDQVLVNLDGFDPVLQGKLELAGHNLLVLGLEWDAHLEALVLDLLHVPKGWGVGGQGDHVVVAQLLVARGDLAHDGPPGEL